MTEEKQQKDYWMKDNNIFVCDGWKYGIAKDGSTVCVGPVSGVIQTTPVKENPVTKPLTKGNVPVEQPVEVLLHQNKGGRPRKEGEVHRQTKWRREKQGMLL